MAKYEILAASAGILAIISFSTLLYKIFLTYNTTSLPWTWVISNLIAQTFMLIYGIANKLQGIIWPSFVFILGLVYITIIKSFHESHDKFVEKEEKNK
jgi:hypothetical protein